MMSSIRAKLPHPNVEPRDVRMGHPRGSCRDSGCCSIGALAWAAPPVQKWERPTLANDARMGHPRFVVAPTKPLPVSG
jgi:hypothetical protein